MDAAASKAAIPSGELDADTQISGGRNINNFNESFEYNLR